jgi:hypothetical protein
VDPFGKISIDQIGFMVIIIFERKNLGRLDNFFWQEYNLPLWQTITQMFLLMDMHNKLSISKKGDK